MRLALLAVSTLVLTACGGLPPRDGDGREMSPRARKFARLEADVPAFGGLAHDEAGWTVFTRDASREADAADAVAEIFSEPGDDRFTIRVRPARGDGSEQLKGDAGNAVSDVESLVSIGYDELTGYVRIGFHEPDDVDAVEDGLTQAQISLDQIILQVVYPIRLL